MAAYDSLKRLVQQAIRTNGNNEITGQVLQNVLMAMIDELGGENGYAGVATPSTNPGAPDGKVFYFATEAGTYTHFDGATLSRGIHLLVFNGVTWSHQTLYTIDSEVTSGSNNLITSGAVYNKIINAINALDATVSKSAGADGLSLSLTEVDGKVTNISGSIAPQTYDAYGAASAAQIAAATDATNKVNAAKTQILGDAESDYNTLGKLEDKIQAEASRAAAAESALNTAKANKANTLAGYGINDAYTKTEVNGLVSTPHQNYVTVPTYASLPTTGSADTIYRVSNYNGSTSQVDASVYSEYAWNGSGYTFLRVVSQIGEVFDITVYNSNTKYADLAAALGTNGANVPSSIRRGGMSVKFVQSSDNKYVQFRYMGTSTANADFTNVADWQGVDDEPTAGSDNLITSGGVNKSFEPLTTDIYGYFGDTSKVLQPNSIFVSIDRSKEKPIKASGIKFKHVANKAIQFWKVSISEGVSTTTAITDELIFNTTGEDILFVDIELSENDYVGVSGYFYYQGSGAPASSGYTSTPKEGGSIGVFSNQQALGFQLVDYTSNVNASRIAENTPTIQQNTEDIFANSQIELKKHIDTLLDIQDLQHMDWSLYTNLYIGDSVYVNLMRESGKRITDVFYKTTGGTSIFYLVTTEDGEYTSIDEIQSNTEDSKDTAFIAHCHFTNPIELQEGQYIGISGNLYYSNSVNDKAYNSVSIGSQILYQKNAEIAYIAFDATLEDKSVIKNDALLILQPNDFINKGGHVMDDGTYNPTLNTNRHTELIDVSSYYRITALFQTQGIGGTHGHAILFYDEHLNLIKTCTAYSYTRNCLFDEWLDKNIKYMIINVYYNVNGADYTTYKCFGYKRISIKKTQNVLYRKKFNSTAVDPEYVNASSSSFTENGLLINSSTAIRFNRYYSLQTRTLRLLLKFNSQTVFKVASSDGSSYVEINTGTATMTMYATTPQSVYIADFSSGYMYLLEVIRDYEKNIARITNINKGTVYEIEFTENGTGGAGRGSVGTYASAGTWHDYYEFSVSSGSAYIKEMNIAPLYGKVKTLLYGDSVTELLYYPSTDYSKSWVQQFISACTNRVMVSPRGGTSIGDILLRIPNELPYIDAQYVMITIGTNGGVTFENMCELVEYIIKHGAIPVLNHIPCNINSGGTSNQATINAIVDSVRTKYGLHGVDFDIATSVNLDGQSVDTNKMWWEDYAEPTGSVYHHPNVIGSNAMFEQIKTDMPELLI